MSSYRLKDGIAMASIPGFGRLRPGQVITGEQFAWLCPSQLVEVPDPAPVEAKPETRPVPAKRVPMKPIMEARSVTPVPAADVPVPVEPEPVVEPVQPVQPVQPEAIEEDVVGNPSYEHPQAVDVSEPVPVVQRVTEPSLPIKRKRGRPRKKVD